MSEGGEGGGVRREGEGEEEREERGRRVRETSRKTEA